MAYPVATTPYPAGSSNPAVPYSGTFIPEIWSGKLIEKFYASTVLAAISNTDYEGEVSQYGDKIIIRTKPTLTIRNYQANQSLVLERPSAPTITMLIDRGKYFATIVDDVLRTQMDIDAMSLWTDEASQQMKIEIDREVLLDLLGKADPKNRGLTAGAISSSVNLGVTGTPINLCARNPGTGEVEIIDLLVRLGQVLDEQNIPEQGRWVLIPAWAASYVKQSDLRNAGLSGDSQSMLRNGRLGQVDRFTLYTSNLLPQSTTPGIPAATLAAGEYPIFAGTSHALSFASQITNVETIRSESTFGNILRGLNVYGFKVLDGTALAQAIVTP